MRFHQALFETAVTAAILAVGVLAACSNAAGGGNSSGAASKTSASAAVTSHVNCSTASLS